MRIQGKLITATTNKSKWRLIFETENNVGGDLGKLYEKNLDIDIKVHREARSLEQNNFYWNICDALAKHERTNKGVIHEKMVEDYGTYTYLAVPAGEEAKLQGLFKLIKDRGETTLTTESGKKLVCKQLQCFKSSSEYTTEEFAILLDGAIETALKTLGENELEQLKELHEWKA